MNTPPALGLGSVATYTPLSNDLTTDDLIAAVKAGCGGGNATTDYFTHVNAMGQLYNTLGQNGASAWLTAESSTIPGAQVYYINASDAFGKQYYISMAVNNLNQDGDGNVVKNGTTQTINGVTYEGVMTIDMTCGYSNYTFSKISWWVGTSIGGIVATKVLLPPLVTALKSVATTMANRIQSLYQNPEPAEEGGEDEENAETEAEAGGETDIAADAGGDVAVEVAAEGASIAGTAFIGVGVVLAVGFIVASFVLHNSYHNIRLWNLTNYSIDWNVSFDSSQAEDEGIMSKGPVTFNGTSIDTYNTLKPVINGPPVPGTNPTNQAYYYDMSFVSSHEFSGIGYAMQFKLKDTSDVTQYVATCYFDIPFSGDNSTNVSLDPSITDLQEWYTENEGNNKNTSASTTSSDGKIVFSTTYDFLSGEHPIPGQEGGSSNEAYFYQSLIGLVQTDLGTGSATAVDASMNAPVPLVDRKRDVFAGLHPRLRRKVEYALKAAQKATPPVKA